MFEIKKSVSCKQALDWIRGWSYYDNEQHMRYINENDMNYGPILVYNSTVHYYVYMDSTNELREIDRWIDEVPEKREAEPIFHGDLSPRRIRALMLITKMFGGKVVIEFEHRHPTNVDIAYEYSFIDGRGELSGKSGMLAVLERYYPTISADLLGVETDLAGVEKKAKEEGEMVAKEEWREKVEGWKASPDLCDDCGEKADEHLKVGERLSALFPSTCGEFKKERK